MGGKMIGRETTKMSIIFESDELSDLQAAVLRMLWAWQARKDAQHPDAEEHIERYQRLYVKISGARWSKDEARTEPT
jgi:hypothetical protein